MRNISKLALTAGVMLAMALTFSCSGGDGGDNPANNNTPDNNSNGGNATHDSRLINADGEAWVLGESCEVANFAATVFKSNGGFISGKFINGVWEADGLNRTWRTNGDKLIITEGSREESFTYEVLSNGTMRSFEENKWRTHTKCGGMTVVWQ